MHGWRFRLRGCASTMYKTERIQSCMQNTNVGGSRNVFNMTLWGRRRDSAASHDDPLPLIRLIKGWSPLMDKMACFGRKKRTIGGGGAQHTHTPQLNPPIRRNDHFFMVQIDASATLWSNRNTSTICRLHIP